MSAGRMCAALFIAVTTAVALVFAPASVGADTRAWTGRYTMVSYASQKVGTSVAARQPEADFSAEFVFATSCSTGRCVATVVDGPAPTNPTIPQPPRYTWDGTQWQYTYDWVWDCFLGDGVAKQWSPATSWVFYAPQPDGSLRGTWHTDISTGACRGNVIMPVAAVPVRS